MKQKKPYSNSYIFLITIVIALSFLVYFSSYNFGNYRFFSIQSGSMEPVLKKGDLILVKKQKTYNINSIVTVERESDITLTHRLVSIDEDKDSGSKTYKTKGDKNKFTDIENFSKEDIIGKMLFKLNLLGTLVDFLKTDLGLGIFIIIPASYIIFKELESIKSEVKKIGKIKFK